MIAVSWGSATERGPRRNNQDALLAEPPVFVVADGMGGHAGGELASAIVVETFRAVVGHGDVPPSAVSELITRANETILQHADADPGLRGMGTTLVALVMVNDGQADYWLVANVGDSRLYRFADGQLRQLTDDHSFVQELVDAGRIRADEARVHPQRNIVTRVLGSAQPPEAEYWLFAPVPGERYLLCSDGICGELEEPAIARLMGGVPDPGLAAAALVGEALRAGGTDNATAIVIDVWNADPLPPPPVETGYASAYVAPGDQTNPGLRVPPVAPVDPMQRARGVHRADRAAERITETDRTYPVTPAEEGAMILGVPDHYDDYDPFPR
jgi:serine/threonine protein phosphatase PrpC